MTYRIFCLYASLKGEGPSPWMIAAEDEYAWEGDPDRCEAVFKRAKEDAEKNGWDVREVTLVLNPDPIWGAFVPAEVAASAEAVRETSE